MTTKGSLDSAIRKALTNLAEEFQTGWSGRREREIVSLFCFGYLINECAKSTSLSDPTQIGIEVPVPQIKSQSILAGKPSHKDQVCKDIVIWDKPRQTCWDASGLPTVAPISIVEWKHNMKCVAKEDVKWLTEFSLEHPHFGGYAVCTHDQTFSDFRISCCRIASGRTEEQWLLIPS